MAPIPDVYLFTNYQHYLAEYYQAMKRSNPKYSHRTMADTMGFSSPNFLKLVMDGNRHISRKSLDKIIAGIGFKKKEAEYFSFLVFFLKAKSTVDKNNYFNQITAIRGKKLATFRPDQCAYYNEWFNAIVRELVIGKNAGTIDYTQLAHKIVPPVLPKQAKKSVQLLQRIGMIHIDQSGKFVYSNPPVCPQNELHCFALKKYHTSMLDLSRSSLESLTPEQCEISSCTIKISSHGFTKIRTRLQAMRAEILQIAKEDRDADRVAQVNFQLFPVSKRDI